MKQYLVHSFTTYRVYEADNGLPVGPCVFETTSEPRAKNFARVLSETNDATSAVRALDEDCAHLEMDL